VTGPRAWNPDDDVRGLRRAFAVALTDDQYRALLFVLWEQYSNRNLAHVVGRATGRDPILVDNDAAAVMSSGPPAPEAIGWVRDRLDAVGWAWDTE
jgi:hypothetical protein